MAHSPHINPYGIPLLDVGRDVHGRFTKANPGGPGNPFARQVAALRKALIDSVSGQDLREVAEIVKLKAKQGDLAAVKLLLQYCVGKPEPAKDPDRMDVDEWQRLQQMRVCHEQFEETIEDTPACIACHMAQTYWPCMAQEDAALAQTIHDAHQQLQAADQAAAPAKPGKGAPDVAQPQAAPARPEAATANQAGESKAPTEPAAPKAQRPSPAKAESKSEDRREPAVRSRRDGHSTTDSPSPNGGNGHGQRQAKEQRKRPPQPSRPSGQTKRKPPRG
jgi:hypothetical protein